MRDLAPIHPGEHLAEFLDEYGVTAYRLAKDTHIPPDRVSKIMHGKRGITADTALRLGRYFGTEPQFWLNLQALYDLETARDKVGQEVEQEIRPLTVV